MSRPDEATGTGEDILRLLVRAEARRYAREGVRLPPKGAWARFCLEFPLNFLGVGMARLARAIPPARLSALQDMLFGAIAGQARLPFDAADPCLDGAKRLLERAQARGTRPAAVLCLMSHPPVTPETLNLNVEMVRHALLALGGRLLPMSRPRILAAVDAFALDHLALIEEGVYAGFVGTYHVGLDRLSSGRRPLSRFLLGAASWPRVPWRLARLLRGGGGVAVVPAGGVPATARILYTVREYMARLRRGRETGMIPERALARLMLQDNGFGEFFRKGPVGENLRRNAWRMMEAWVAATMVGEWRAERRGEQGSAPPDFHSGRLSGEARDCLRSYARALGYGEAEFEASLRLFEPEFSRETPYRERFFSFLARRLVARGTPLLLLPLCHRLPGTDSTDGRVRLVWREPVLLHAMRGGCLIILREGPQGPVEASVPVGRFARDFVSLHYS